MVSRKQVDPSRTVTLYDMVKTTPREIQAETEADAPAGLLAGSHAATTTKTIAPSIALVVALAIGNHRTSLTDPIASKHLIGTTQTQLTSQLPTASKLHTNSA